MTILTKIILAVIGIVLCGAMFYYAANGKGLTKNGQKLVRIVATSLFVIMALIVIFEKTI